MNKSNFNWLSVRQLSLLETMLAFALPSVIAFIGFRLLLPVLIDHGVPVIAGWPMVASGMLFLFVLAAIYLLKKEANSTGISFAARACLGKISGKEWFIYLVILMAGLLITMLLQKASIYLSKISLFQVPDYYPFFLNPQIDPAKAGMNQLSPGFPVQGEYWLIGLMGLTLILNILTEELYFRAWLLPKMSSLKQVSWILNGVLFAFYHTFQLWLLPQILPMSLIMAFVVYKSRSIWPAFAIHMIVNSLNVMGLISIVAS